MGLLLIMCSRSLHRVPTAFLDWGYIRARLFKTNDIVCSRFVKFSEVDFSNRPIFFVEKM